MNIWNTMQEMLSPEDSGRSGRASAAGAGNATLKPIPADALAIVPLRNAVLFPGVMSPISIGRIWAEMPTAVSSSDLAFIAAAASGSRSTTGSTISGPP